MDSERQKTQNIQNCSSIRTDKKEVVSFKTKHIPKNRRIDIIHSSE
jgi:hypothetical protein